MKKLLFKNAKVVSAHGIDEKDVVVNAGEIFKVCEDGEGEDVMVNILEEGEEFETIDCSGEDKYLLPGLVDAHVHFREPGMTAKGDFASESAAALAGGVTTIFDMPNTKPATVTFEAFAAKVELAKEKCKCHFKIFVGAAEVDGKANLEEIKKIVADDELRRFLAGIKVYMAHSTGDMGASGVLEAMLADEKLREIDGRVLPIVVHAEDQECLDEFAEGFDLSVPGNHGKARPVECCLKAVKEACHLARKHKRSVHIAHVSSREELDEIGKFKDGLVTCEVSPRHLFLNDGMYEKLGGFLKVNPPVRSKEEVGELWKGVYAGEIDIVATDHSPHTREEKEGAGGGIAPSGMPDVQTLLPLMLNEVVGEKLDLQKVVEMCCEKPAEIFGLENVGKIEDGGRADLILVDLGEERIVGKGEAALKYKCGWSCYEGWKLSGWPEVVVLAGEVV